ncbi:hypothetical protein Anapl_13152 [Anas platyrhynchos]|uniref:Uncharacterized protein n=1 Tax=Anas platyrhynchos TaxID=8839 RepID=R0LZQ0_ANAPL|nr:hypothetical protein Anapl_13152 [Anas platyrhynchos]
MATLQKEVKAVPPGSCAWALASERCKNMSEDRMLINEQNLDKQMQGHPLSDFSYMDLKARTHGEPFGSLQVPVDQLVPASDAGHLAESSEVSVSPKELAGAPEQGGWVRIEGSRQTRTGCSTRHSYPMNTSINVNCQLSDSNQNKATKLENREQTQNTGLLRAVTCCAF